LSFVATAGAADKEVTLKGTVTCAKCDLGTSDKCATVIKVQEDGKDVVYYFDKASNKKYHGKICTAPTEGTVKGTISEEGDKKIVKVTQLDWSK
jgi:hypothetical protein